MKVILNQDIPLAEDIRLIKRLYKVPVDKDFPIGLKFAYQYLSFKNNEWIEVCRIDNYAHGKKKIGTHIHKYGSRGVEFKNMNFEEAEKYIISLGERLSKRL